MEEFGLSHDDFHHLIGLAIMFVLVLLKRSLKIPKRILPVLSLCLGLVGGLLLVLQGFHSLTKGVFEGIFFGLEASGLYSVQKSLRGK